MELSVPSALLCDKKVHNIWSFNLQLSFCCRVLFIRVALDFSVQDHVLSLNLLLFTIQATAAFYFSPAVPFIINYRVCRSTSVKIEVKAM